MHSSEAKCVEASESCVVMYLCLAKFQYGMNMPQDFCFSQLVYVRMHLQCVCVQTGPTYWLSLHSCCGSFLCAAVVTMCLSCLKQTKKSYRTSEILCAGGTWILLRSQEIISGLIKQWQQSLCFAGPFQQAHVYNIKIFIGTLDLGVSCRTIKNKRNTTVKIQIMKLDVKGTVSKGRRKSLKINFDSFFCLFNQVTVQ